MLCYVILNYNDSNTTINYLKSIRNFSIIDHIVVVDNKSTDNSFQEINRYRTEKIDVITTEKNGGYGYGNNYGIKYAKEKYNPDYVIISNPDVSIEETSINDCLRFMEEHKDASIVSMLMQNTDGSFNYKCTWKIPTYFEYLMFSTLLGAKINYNYKPELFDQEYFQCDCVAGSWLMVRTNDFIKMGMYDERVFLYCEEMIIGLRARKNGMKTYILPNSSFIHMHSVSISKTIKSDMAQQKIMWKSRKYVLDNYYPHSFGKKILTKIICNYALVERRVIQFVRALKRGLVR